MGTMEYIGDREILSSRTISYELPTPLAQPTNAGCRGDKINSLLMIFVE